MRERHNDDGEFLARDVVQVARNAAALLILQPKQAAGKGVERGFRILQVLAGLVGLCDVFDDDLNGSLAVGCHRIQQEANFARPRRADDPHLSFGGAVLRHAKSSVKRVPTVRSDKVLHTQANRINGGDDAENLGKLLVRP